MYKLPLSPTDLTTIYKKKLAEPDTHVLLVDYTASKEVLTPKQILIYLANTGFRCAFSEVDTELIEEYVQLNFLVDSPLLSRVVGNIMLSQLGAPVNAGYDNDFINSFDSTTIKHLIKDISGLLPFVISSINNLDSGIAIDIKTSVHSSKDSTTGINVLNVIVHCTDVVMCVIKNLGFIPTYNNVIFNSDSKYGGKDIFAALHEHSIVPLMFKFIPDELVSKKLHADN